jgi:CheY-like chemotaxis protein
MNQTVVPKTRLRAMYAAMLVATVVPPVIATTYTVGGNLAWVDGLYWTLCMTSVAAVSAVLGLIFAVPRARADFIPGASERYSANSNLEQISDWLTKLLVGAGLVNLKALPGQVASFGDFLATSMGAPTARGFATSAVVYGGGLGFVTGYLWTRLKLRFLLEQSDHDAQRASLEERVAQTLAGQDGKSGESSSDLRRAATQALLTVESAAGRQRLPILWVDDHPENNASIIAALQALGITVVTALSTEEALEKLGAADFALVITDLGRREAGTQRDMAGLELLTAMKELPLAPPSVVFAGPRGLQNRDQLLAAGARLVTQKPSEVFNEAVRYVTGSVPL